MVSASKTKAVVAEVRAEDPADPVVLPPAVVGVEPEQPIEIYPDVVDPILAV